jgi:hypothetical protein
MPPGATEHFEIVTSTQKPQTYFSEEDLSMCMMAESGQMQEACSIDVAGRVNGLVLSDMGNAQLQTQPWQTWESSSGVPQVIWVPTLMIPCQPDGESYEGTEVRNDAAPVSHVPGTWHVPADTWTCPCGFHNKHTNQICGGTGPLGCKRPRGDARHHDFHGDRMKVGSKKKVWKNPTRKEKSLITLAQQAQAGRQFSGAPRRDLEELKQLHTQLKQRTALIEGKDLEDSDWLRQQSTEDGGSQSSHSTQERGMAFCPYCGGDIKPRYKFCQYCGAALTDFSS